MSIWDDPDIRAGGEFIKLEKPGDFAAGVVQAIRKHTFDDGKVAPQVLLVTDDGEERTLTAGQVQLKAKLAEQRPEAGDWIRVTLTQVEQRAGGKSLKHFNVELRRGNGQPAQPQTQAAPVQQPYAPQQPPAAPQQWAPPPPPGGYQPAPQAAPVPPAMPAQPPTQPHAAPPVPGGVQLTPEQQAAMAVLTPEQRAALGFPAQ